MDELESKLGEGSCFILMISSYFN